MITIGKRSALLPAGGFGQNALGPVQGIVAATFIHYVSRSIDKESDVQLHVHAVIPNIGATERGYRALEFSNLYNNRRYFQAVFHAELAQRLRVLGYRLRPRRDFGFEIEGISAALIQKYSRRTQAIEARAKELGITDIRQKDRLGAKNRAAKDTRSLEHLKALWQSRLTPDERKTLEQARPGDPILPRPASAEYWLQQTLDYLLERQSVVTRSDWFAETLRWTAGAVSVRDLDTAVHRLPQILTREEQGQTYISTELVRSQEAELIACARRGRGQYLPLNARYRVDPSLSAEQEQAVQQLLNGYHGVQLLLGKAGTGKTRVLAELSAGIAAGGAELIALAPTTRARDVLASEGLPAMTLAAFLQHPLPGKVILLDEAGLASTPDLLRLARWAEEQRSRLILVGDYLQHRSINRGMPLKLISERSGLSPVRLDNIRRQAEATYREAVRALARHDTQKGLKLLDQMGSIHQEADSASRYRRIAERYAELTARGETCCCICPTHAEGGALTVALRQTLLEQGRLGQESWRVSVLLPLPLTEVEKQIGLSALQDHHHLQQLWIQFDRHVPGFQAVGIV
jgi:hypothetical protein